LFDDWSLGIGAYIIMSSDPNIKVKVVFACLDWRLHPQIEQFFSQNGGCDMCVTAGSVKDLIAPATQELFLKQISISKQLHNCQGVALTMHMDCGAYGGSAAFEYAAKETQLCKSELVRAKAIVAARFPELSVETWIIGLEHSGSGWNISPERIDL